MNTNNIRQYLLNGLDPNPELVSDAPFMGTLENWEPGQFGMIRATKIGGTEDPIFTGLTGAGLAPFGELYTYDNYNTKTIIGGTPTDYANNHSLCCTSNGMVFFAGPSPSLSMTTIGARLYTPSNNAVFWCGAFNQGLGLALADDTLLQMLADPADDGLDHWQDMSVGYKEFSSEVLGLHRLPGGAVLVCTAQGLYRIYPTDFERFTFGQEHLTTDVCYVPMNLKCLTPLVVNDEGDILLIGADGVQKLGYKQTLNSKASDITRVTYDSYRNTYYICTDEYTYILNESGLWVLQQHVQAKTDILEFAENPLTLPQSLAETVPFTLGVEGIKSLKGVLLRHTGLVEVSFGFREQSGAPFAYTAWMEPDSRGAVNKVVTGYEFTIRMRASAPVTVSDLDVTWTNAVKTNFSQISRRV